MNQRTKVVGIALISIILASAGAYEVLTSSSGGDPCASVASGVSNGTLAISPQLFPGRTAAGGSAPPAAGRPEAAGLAASGVISVVAAENFWGSLVGQLGGSHTSVLSIVSDPNADPHEYEVNSTDATAIAGAQFVIVNGVGYDDWALQMIAADNNPHQQVLNVGDLNGVSVGGGIVSGNPHLWYNPPYVNVTVAAMYSALVSLQPASAPYFQANYAMLNESLAQLYGQAGEIRDRFAGTEVASTESIFVYLANYTHLDLVSPPEFMGAVAEGNDPPAESVVEFQCQLEAGHVRMLVYNVQTVSPITSEMESIASAQHIPVVGVSETVQPPGLTFQAWMASEYGNLLNALNESALGR